MTAAAYIPEKPTLPRVREAVQHCKACDLWRMGTQAVFGEGAPDAVVMFVGRAAGRPRGSRGQAVRRARGKLFDKALEDAGIDRSQAYVTNVVKHFKWEARGKRRIHAKPSWAEMTACRPWLDTELALVKPRVLVCLGATAAQSLLGRQFRVTRQRGELIDSPLAEHVIATAHPSSILRARDDDARREEMEAFVADLRKVAALL